MNRTSILLLWTLTGATAALAADDKWDIAKIDMSKLPPPASATGVTYEKDIRPLFEASCFRCHGAQRPKAKLQLDSLGAVLKGGEDGKVVVPGSSTQSLLMAAVARVNDDIAMPPKFRPRGGRGPGGPGGPPPGGEAPPPGGGPGGGPGGPGGQRGGPPPKPLTPDQASLVRAWIDQGAK